MFFILTSSQFSCYQASQSSIRCFEMPIYVNLRKISLKSRLHANRKIPNHYRSMDEYILFLNSIKEINSRLKTISHYGITKFTPFIETTMRNRKAICRIIRILPIMLNLSLVRCFTLSLISYLWAYHSSELLWSFHEILRNLILCFTLLHIEVTVCASIVI